MSDLLSIGASGVRAYQTALGTVSENIANSGVAGYSRRLTDLREVAATGGGLAASRITGGLGVRVAGISRQADAFKAEAVRSAGADLAKTEIGIAWLDRIEGALGGDQLAARMTGFFTAARTLAADPSSLAARGVMLEAGTAVANAFAGTGGSLAQAETDLDASAADATDQLGALGQALATINERIGRTTPGSAPAAAMADQRDRLLEEMSAFVDLSVTTDAVGRATVRLGGGAGPVFVAGGDAGQVTYVRGTTGAVAFAVYRAGEASVLAPGGGALGGIADGATRIADARARLDGLATGFAGAVNAVQAGGRDLDGNAGAAFFATGDRPSDLRLALTDPRGIAAAGAGGGPRDASNLDALERARSSGGFESGLSGLVAGNAAALGQRRIVGEAQDAIREGAVNARDAASGVDLDTEAVELIRFQQAYQASSRVIQVARETLQTILEIR